MLTLFSISSQQQHKVIEAPVTKKKGKRTKSTKTRIVGGRIYDPANGKTCHQCRQKTMDKAAWCKNLKDGKKRCTLHFCFNCLSNRYGEKVDDVAELSNWNCPKCRDICNCSCCMKDKGHQPTGQLAKWGKALGFKSVVDMLPHLDSLKEKGLIPRPKTKVAKKKGKMIDETNSSSNKVLSINAAPILRPDDHSYPNKRPVQELMSLSNESSSNGNNFFQLDTSKDLEQMTSLEISNGARESRSPKRCKISNEIQEEETIRKANDDDDDIELFNEGTWNNIDFDGEIDDDPSKWDEKKVFDSLAFAVDSFLSDFKF
ncbi:hypothetical protein RIF29_19413 [Crotalaria pallida]|uniref:Zinc-finger domain-containing protein n=1 Tax=Crotalaria pallida TaxID=3830 RepID=A0AAN9EZG6_CROPI